MARVDKETYDDFLNRHPIISYHWLEKDMISSKGSKRGEVRYGWNGYAWMFSRKSPYDGRYYCAITTPVEAGEKGWKYLRPSDTGAPVVPPNPTITEIGGINLTKLVNEQIAFHKKALEERVEFLERLVQRNMEIMAVRADATGQKLHDLEGWADQVEKLLALTTKRLDDGWEVLKSHKAELDRRSK